MNTIITRVATALLVDYSAVYYVDLNTGRYECYSTNTNFKGLSLSRSGEDFFSDNVRDIGSVAYEEDREMLLEALSRESLARYIERDPDETVVYRLVVDGEPVYHSMKILRDEGEKEDFVIIGVKNVDDEVRQREELKTISEQSVLFNHIAESLARQYGMIYYIDAVTDEYVEFTAAEEYRFFDISPTGSDFFGSSQRNVSMIAHPDDREMLFDALDKNTMLKNLENDGFYTLTYRLMLEDRISYTQMLVFWANDSQHLIMCVKNIDNEIQRENAMKKMVAENLIFSQIAESLAGQYDTLYYVDMLTERYMEYSSTDVYKSLGVRPEGEDFFNESLRNIQRVIYPEDRQAVMRIFDKPTVIRMLQEKHMITHTYRLMIQDGIMYARMSIIWARDNKHIIVGVMNIDNEVRRDKEAQERLYAANEKAYRDEMTGVKNKSAYKDFEANLQNSIETDADVEFAVAVCDINGLKEINDHKGHIEGDEYIKSAAQIICHNWEHSPVFRIGGDEFAVIMQGSDYQDRARLLEHMKRRVMENLENGKVTVAVGASDFVPGADLSVADVFSRADELMYQDKARLKSLTGAGSAGADADGPA